MRALLVVMVVLVLTQHVAGASPGDWWLAPVERLVGSASAFDETPRPYNTPLHMRQIAGDIALSCEHREGRPCGDGKAVYSELDSGAGFRDVISVSTRLRAQSGSSVDDTVLVDRLHLDAHLGPVAAELGRDAVSFGPVVRTALGWGDNAPPIDHIRVGTSHPWELHSKVHVSGAYLVGRLRAPQRYPNALVTIGRGQADLGANVSVGILHLLQLEGDGAPHLGVWDFIAEHFRRKDLSATETDTSNRRFGGDMTVRFPDLHDLRLYYELIFEDIRARRLIDAVRYDADHLVGAQLPSSNWVVTVEYHQTGARSEEHSARTTGFTHGGFSVGSPLGPDARSLFASVEAKFRKNGVSVTPWIELVQLRNRTLEYITFGPINVVAEGEDEGRVRLGTRVALPVTPTVSAEAEVMYERIDDFGFQPGAMRTNGGVRTMIVWQPDGRLGKLVLN